MGFQRGDFVEVWSFPLRCVICTGEVRGLSGKRTRQGYEMYRVRLEGLGGEVLVVAASQLRKLVR